MQTPSPPFTLKQEDHGVRKLFLFYSQLTKSADFIKVLVTRRKNPFFSYVQQENRRNSNMHRRGRIHPLALDMYKHTTVSLCCLSASFHDVLRFPCESREACGGDGDVWRGRHLADGAGTWQPGPVLEAGAQLQGRGRSRRALHEGVRRADGRQPRQGAGQSGGRGRGERASEQRVHLVRGCRGCCCGGGCGGSAGVSTRAGAAVEGWVLAPVNLPHQPLHLIQRAGEHQYVVPGQKQCGDLGQLPHGGPVRVRHHLAQTVHGQVKVVHALALPAVNLEAQLVHFFLGDLLLQFVLVASSSSSAAAAASHRLGVSRAQELSAAQLLALLFSALRGRGDRGAAVVVVVVVVMLQKHVVHVRGRGSAARAGVWMHFMGLPPS